MNRVAKLGYKKLLEGSNWQTCGMQVRVEGSVEKVPEEE
jgi:pyridoxine/pyridoxamine 5'-phosphate oxidase